MNILVIEDNRTLQGAIRRALAKSGYQVTVAGDGHEGLDVACKLLPDLIVLDIMLPGLSGTCVLRALRNQAATKIIPVFVLTGLSQKNERRLLEAGATRYFEKSDSLLDRDFAALIQAVGECVARRP